MCFTYYSKSVKKSNISSVSQFLACSYITCVAPAKRRNPYYVHYDPYYLSGLIWTVAKGRNSLVIL